MEEIRQAALEALAAGVPSIRRMLVRVCIVRGGRILVVRRSDEEDWLPGQWQLPCGAVEEGEAPPEAAAREVREEVGVALAPHELLACGTGSFLLHRPDKGVVEDWGNVNFLVAADEDCRPEAGPEHSALEWLTPERALARVPEASDREAIRQATGLARRAAELQRRSGLAG